MLFVDSRDMFGNGPTKEIPMLRAAGAPSASTVGAVGCLYMDTDSGTVYKCTAVSDGIYTWGALIDETEIQAIVDAYLEANPPSSDSGENVTIDSTLTQSGKAAEAAATGKKIDQLFSEIAALMDDEDVNAAIKAYLQANSQAMGTLSINGQQYNGSSDVVVEVATESSGSSESYAEEQLATGTIPAETAAASLIDTGVTLAQLKRFKKFGFVFRGEGNSALANTYVTCGRDYNGLGIDRFDSAGRVWLAEWVNAEESLLRIVAAWGGNPSLVRPIGSSFVVSNPTAKWGDGNGGSGGLFLFDLSSADDADTLKIYLSTATTIAYSWEVRGVTV